MEKEIKFRSMSELDTYRENLKTGIAEYEKELKSGNISEERAKILNAIIVTNKAKVMKIDMLMEDALNKSFEEIAISENGLKISLPSYDPEIVRVMVEGRRALGTGEVPQAEDKNQTTIDFDKEEKNKKTKEASSQIIEIEDTVEDIPETLAELLFPKKRDLEELKNILQKVLKNETFETIAGQVLKLLRAQPDFEKENTGALFTDVLLRKLKCEGMPTSSFWSWTGKHIINPIKSERNPVKSLLMVKRSIPFLSDVEINDLIWTMIKESNGKADNDEASEIMKQTIKRVFEKTTPETITADPSTISLILDIYGKDINIPEKIQNLFKTVSTVCENTQTNPTNIKIVEIQRPRVEEKKEVTEQIKHNPNRPINNYVEKAGNRHKNNKKR